MVIAACIESGVVFLPGQKINPKVQSYCEQFYTEIFHKSSNSVNSLSAVLLPSLMVFFIRASFIILTLRYRVGNSIF